MPELSRRAVMVSTLGGLGVAAAAALPAAPALARGFAGTAAAGAATAVASDAVPVRSLFTPAVGRAFRATEIVDGETAGDRTIDLVLSAVEDIADSAPGDENRFLLLFTASGYTAADGIYTLRRAGAPQVTLFLSAIGPRGMTRAMQAVVSRTA
ncbi:hypothetical protein ASF88_00165 [Leifsonia sp. Leaf336]|uniref:DUF6916 family protein n=1 Tax=Leifsonia sp. Leaf336 TaxID=1736341 RepID=UPI0006F31CBD|nr:hypothetical protein [Leifsonia sp. Leaf336]KQR53356.1 hypothetical protein ASF88_00165 [Leifsonia sp. Leaf336]